MKIFTYILAVLIGMLGLRLLLTSVKAAIFFLKRDAVSPKAKSLLFRDVALGILFLILAFAMVT